MSNAAIDWALSTKTGSASAKAVLLVLANHADAEGRCWPSQARIAEQSEQSVDTVQRRLRDLEEQGLVRRQPRYKEDGGRWSDLYLLAVPRGETMVGTPTADSGTLTADCGIPHRTAAVPPTAPVRYEPSLEPSSNQRASHGAHAPRNVPSEPVYTDDKHRLFGEGVPTLVQLGLKEPRARQMIGKWLRDTSDSARAVLDAILRARERRVVDPIPWITQALPTAKNGTTNEPASLLAAAKRVAGLVASGGSGGD